MKTERLDRAPRYGLRFALLGAFFLVIFFVSFLLGRYGVTPGSLARILGSKLLETLSFGAYTPVPDWSGMDTLQDFVERYVSIADVTTETEQRKMATAVFAGKTLLMINANTIYFKFRASIRAADHYSYQAY